MVLCQQKLSKVCGFCNQSISGSIKSSVQKDYKVRDIFLDITKIFDKIWHEALLLKLKQKGISGNHLSIVKDF